MLTRLLIPAICLISLTGCFTGIESTPKITESDLRRQHVTTPPEQLILADLRPLPLKEWAHGKPLYVADSRITLAMTTKVDKDLRGSCIYYAGIDSAVSVTGTNVSILRFVDGDGDTLSYRINMAPHALMSRESVNIPFTVDVALVEQANQKLKGSKLYIMTRLWCDSLGRQVTGRKFVPVTVTDVLPGTPELPLLVMFADDEGATNRGVLISANPSSRSGRRFDTSFSLSNPRARYTSIADDHWRLIINGKVAEQMTPEECRLSLGTPETIDRVPTYGGVLERWTYPDGSYLLFTEGVLQQFRQ